MIDVNLARRLVDAQFPHWADLPITRVEVDGVDNRTFRLGDELTVRLPSGPWYALQVEKEQRWLPRLAPQLPLPIPAPVAQGEPDDGYPYAWSVYRWLDGEPAAGAAIADLTAFATELAGFLVALRRADATGGPGPGRHNFFRGGPLTTYADETVQAVEALGDEIRGDAVMRVWDDALAARWDGDPVWTLLSGASRAAFRSALGADAATWSRGRGWALWKALISLAGALEHDDRDAAAVNRRVIERVLEDRAGQC